MDLVLKTDIHGNRQRFAAGPLDLFRSRIDRARKLGMRLDGLTGNHDVGAIAGCAQPNRQPDAAAGSGNEKCLTRKTPHGNPPASLS